MRGQLSIVLILGILVAILAILNPELLAQPVTLNLFGFSYEGPLVMILLVLAPGSWVLLLAIGALAEVGWRQRIRALTADVSAREHEIIALKAVAYDRQQRAPEESGGTGPPQSLP